MVPEIEKISSLRSFESFRSDGFLLFRQPYQENDLIVDLLLERGLRISALVRGGQKSIKRFGGKLEPLKLLRLQLRSPKGNFNHHAGLHVSNYESLFSLEAADVVESYDGYKENWNALSEGLFFTEFARDLFSRGEVESWMYRDFFKVIVVGHHLSPSDWRRLYVWNYFSKEMGFGVLGEKGLLSQALEDDFTEWQQLFEAEFFSPKAVEFMERISGKVLEKKLIRDFYSDWMQRSHLRCKSLESWALSTSLSTSL